MKLIAFSPDAIPQVWPAMKNDLSHALKMDQRRTLNDVFRCLVSGQMEAVVVDGDARGLIILERDNSSLWVVYAVGRKMGWTIANIRETMKAICELAVRNGLDAVLLSGRKGWFRALASDGFEISGKLDGMPIIKKVL